MNSPVNFFGGYQVGSPSNKNAWRDSQAKPKISRNDEDSVARKQQSNMPGRPAQGNVFGLVRSTHIHVVLEMSPSEATARPMQQPAMVGIFEGIAPQQSNHQAGQPACQTRMKMKCQKHAR